ncbi:hypothetical protein DICPUDRAFT_92744 [Dictyostelium purpureum]|uniref:EF-hand domain-containing protein n=1 Tax=Dictyostelium purpureum TaxID=5786 RepID=F0ZWN1_DICPU|nr:uncharacterized protein DICPUDRAFT_92744 [Dictyostelium purpureum]EGC31659.1 hypothetical protein DICPUDRAFT_92744 [Dictyostelium purpureum]|eukprot:XP_003291825.1 hypothetical protein DICPUDRAFT_92744 [Dictyostelium purpureum]
MDSKLVQHVEDLLADHKDSKEVTWDEVISYLFNKGVGNPYFATLAIFSSMDTNNDKKISLGEVKVQKFKDQAKKHSQILIRNIESILDENKDDKITWEEACNVFRKDPEVGDAGCENCTKSLFGSVNKNNNREITKDELRTYYSNVKKYTAH